MISIMNPIDLDLEAAAICGLVMYAKDHEDLDPDSSDSSGSD